MLKFFAEAVIIFLCYIAAYFVGFLYPDFMFFGGEIGAETASLLFLPHGVRVLTAWLYGYQSILLLAPVSFITHAIALGSVNLSLDLFIGPLFGVICAAATFDICARLGFDVRMRDNYRANWRSVFIIGALSSVINSVGTNIAYGNDLRSTIAFWAGDVAGLFASLLILTFVFKALRKFTKS